MIRTLAILFVSLLLFAQSGDPPGDPPPEPHPEWEGQRAWCNNDKTTPHKCRCAIAERDCKKEPAPGEPNLYGDGDAEMGSRCQTHCKRDHCHCSSPCTS